MQNSTNQCSSFFKILVGDYAHKIAIPPAFVAKFDGNVPKNAVIKAKIGKSKWVVNIKQFDGSFYFTGQGWEILVMDNDLNINEFVVFRLICDTVYEMASYGLNGCEKVIVAPETSHVGIKEADLDSIFEEAQKRSHVVRRGRPSLNHEKNVNANFLVVMKKTHQYCLTIPKAFARAAGIGRKKFVVLRTKQGKVWRVDIRRRTIKGYSCWRLDTGTGWRDFWSNNKLSMKDSCLFEFVPGTGNVIQVEIFSAK